MNGTRSDAAIRSRSHRAAEMDASLRPENTAEGQKRLREALVAKAKAIVPLLRANAAQADQTRRIPDENLAAMDEAGLLRLRSPSRYGGFEADVRTYIDVVTEIGRGCASTAWIAFISNATAWVACCGFPDQTQDEIFNGNPDARFIGLLAPTSTATAVHGGYRVSGRWAFASGCLHAYWALLAVPLPKEDGTVEPGIVVAPVKDLTIEDTWHVVAMRGTGSHTVVAGDIFVPSHRAQPLSVFLSGKSPRTHAVEFVYRESFAPTAIIMLAAPIIGMAKAALEFTLERIRTGNKRISYSFYDDLRKSPSMQLQLADAATLIETGQLHVNRWSDEIAEAARAGDELPFIRRSQMRIDLGYAMRCCRDAVDLLLSVQGASAFAEANPIQRVWRDIESATRHGLLSPEMPREIYGRALVGNEDPISPFV